MIVSRSDAIIDLTKAEGDALLGKAEATAAMLNWGGHTYKTFRERLEHQASELHYETERTVLIYADDSEEPVARCDDEGFIIEGERSE
jgi:hypothetical protein